MAPHVLVHEQWDGNDGMYHIKAVFGPFASFADAIAWKHSVYKPDERDPCYAMPLQSPTE